MQKVILGKTGLEVSRLNIGTGSSGWAGRSEQTDLGFEGLANLLRTAFDHGINFWDTADEYGSHPHVARALKGLPRDQVVIVTKTTSRQANQVKDDIDRFLKEMETEVIDILLLHCLTKKDWTKSYAGAMEVLTNAKTQGKVRAVGVSCHGFGALKTAAETTWGDVVMVRINPRGVNMDDSPKKVVPVIEKIFNSGKGVYGMKILGNGRLAREAPEMIEYALKLGTIHAFTIGMNSPAQISQNVRLVEELAERYPIQPVNA